MGECLLNRCKKCHREYQFVNGVGALDWGLLNKDNKLNLLHRCASKDREFIRNVINNSQDYELNPDYERKNYLCNKCKMVYNQLDYIITNLKTGEKFYPSHVCSKCGNDMEEVEGLEACPNCGTKFDFKDTLFGSFD